MTGETQQKNLSQITDEFAVAELRVNVEEAKAQAASNTISRLLHQWRARNAGKVLAGLYDRGEIIDYQISHSSLEREKGEYGS